VWKDKICRFPTETSVPFLTPRIDTLRLIKAKYIKDLRCCAIQPSVQAGHQTFAVRMVLQPFVNRTQRDVLRVGRIGPDDEQHAFSLPTIVKSVGDAQVNVEFVLRATEVLRHNFRQGRFHCSNR